METKEIKADSPVTIAGVTLIPITKVSLNCQGCRGGVSFFGVKYPVDIVLVTSSAKRAFRITGEEVPLDQLIQEVPSMREVVEAV